LKTNVIDAKQEHKLKDSSTVTFWSAITTVTRNDHQKLHTFVVKKKDDQIFKLIISKKNHDLQRRQLHYQIIR